MTVLTMNEAMPGSDTPHLPPHLPTILTRLTALPACKKRANHDTATVHVSTNPHREVVGLLETHHSRRGGRTRIEWLSPEHRTQHILLKYCCFVSISVTHTPSTKPALIRTVILQHRFPQNLILERFVTPAICVLQRGAYGRENKISLLPPSQDCWNLGVGVMEVK